MDADQENVTLEAFRVRVRDVMRAYDREHGLRLFKAASYASLTLNQTPVATVFLSQLFPHHTRTIDHDTAFNSLVRVPGLRHGFMKGASGSMVVFVTRAQSLSGDGSDLELCFTRSCDPHGNEELVPSLVAEVPSDALGVGDARAQIHVVGVHLRSCALCAKPARRTRRLYKCARCLDGELDVWYCNRECQRGHWPEHNPVCGAAWR